MLTTKSSWRKRLYLNVYRIATTVGKFFFSRRNGSYTVQCYVMLWTCLNELTSGFKSNSAIIYSRIEDGGWVVLTFLDIVRRFYLFTFEWCLHSVVRITCLILCDIFICLLSYITHKMFHPHLINEAAWLAPLFARKSKQAIEQAIWAQHTPSVTRP